MTTEETAPNLDCTYCGNPATNRYGEPGATEADARCLKQDFYAKESGKVPVLPDRMISTCNSLECDAKFRDEGRDYDWQDWPRHTYLLATQEEKRRAASLHIAKARKRPYKVACREFIDDCCIDHNLPKSEWCNSKGDHGICSRIKGHRGKWHVACSMGRTFVSHKKPQHLLDIWRYITVVRPEPKPATFTSKDAPWG